jgi:hypothetical protein
MGRLLSEVFDNASEVTSYGNSLAAQALIQGVSVEDLPNRALLNRKDEDYLIIIWLQMPKIGFRARLTTKPALTGSGTSTDTIGTVRDACCMEPVFEPPVATIASRASATSPAAYLRAGNRSIRGVSEPISTCPSSARRRDKCSQRFRETNLAVRAITALAGTLSLAELGSTLNCPHGTLASSSPLSSVTQTKHPT